MKTFYYDASHKPGVDPMLRLKDVGLVGLPLEEATARQIADRSENGRLMQGYSTTPGVWAVDAADVSDRVRICCDATERDHRSTSEIPNGVHSWAVFSATPALPSEWTLRHVGLNVSYVTCFYARRDPGEYHPLRFLWGYVS